MTRSALSQGRMSRLAERELSKIYTGDSPLPLNPEAVKGMRLGVSQTAISRALSGDLKPGREQLIVWIEALKAWHASDILRSICLQASQELEKVIPVPVFTEKDERNLMHLVGYLTLEEEAQEIQRITIEVSDQPIIPLSISSTAERSPLFRHLSKDSL